MPDILIRGMEMPSGIHTKEIRICPDGSIYEKINGCFFTMEKTIAKATELPEHGDLIDADAFAETPSMEQEMEETT